MYYPYSSYSWWHCYNCCSSDLDPCYRSPCYMCPAGYWWWWWWYPSNTMSTQQKLIVLMDARKSSKKKHKDEPIPKSE